MTVLNHSYLSLLNLLPCADDDTTGGHVGVSSQDRQRDWPVKVTGPNLRRKPDLGKMPRKLSGKRCP